MAPLRHDTAAISGSGRNFCRSGHRETLEDGGVQ
jgi:hypothetical protein